MIKMIMKNIKRKLAALALGGMLFSGIVKSNEIPISAELSYDQGSIASSISTKI